MGILLCSCAEVHEPIRVSFGEVSGLGSGIDVLGGGPRASRGRADFGVVCLHWPSGVKGLFLKRNVFNVCEKNWIIFIWTIYHWKRLFIGFLNM